MKIRAVIAIFALSLSLAARSQVSIRIFARTRPVTVVFTPDRGEYLLTDGSSTAVRLTTGETVAVTRYDGQVIYRTFSGRSGVADSLAFTPSSAGSLFSLRARARMRLSKSLTGY